MHSAFITINQVPTRITTWGKWIEESFDEYSPKDIVLIIPGNPGISPCYNRFAEIIYQQRGLPVWLIGHAGHELPEKEQFYNVPPFENNYDLYNLEGQIKHKIEFIEKYVPEGVKLHIVAHSVGAYITTRLMGMPEINEKIAKTYLMFPTIEYIGDTPNGKKYREIVERLVPIILFLAWFFTLLPYCLKYALVYIYSFTNGAESFHFQTLCSFIDPRILKRVFFMASDEMLKIKERENNVILANLNKVYVYFGQTDGWGPVSYYYKLKDDIPAIAGEISSKGFSHAFVLRHSKEAGLMVAGWLQ